MIVTVDYSIERGPDLRSGSKFGQAQLDSVRTWRIDARCEPLRPRSECRCQLTRVDLIAHCIVRLNPRKIARSFFDPNPANPRGYEGRRVNGQYTPAAPDHFPLDEESVLLHERSHCKDIVESIQHHVKEALERIEPDLIAQCACDREDLCHRALMNMVSARIAALGREAYQELLQDAEVHQQQSATERRARQAQIDDFQAREPDQDDGD